MQKIVLTIAALVFSQTSFSTPSGKQSCYGYSGGPFLVFSDIESSDSIAIGDSGNGVDPYKYTYLKIESQTNGSCAVCYTFLSHFENSDGKNFEVKIITSASKGGSAFNAEILSRESGHRRWSTWNSRLRCIDWTK